MADSIISDIMLHLFKKLLLLFLPWLVWLSGLSAGLRTKESPI